MSVSSSEDQVADAASDAASGNSVIRKTILFAVLAVMIAALIYDYRVARPAVAKAYDDIATASVEANKNPDDVLTKEDVAKLLDKEPIETFNDGVELVEVYAWTSGIPGRPHKLYTVFKPHGTNHIFYRHAKFAYESSSEVSPVAGKVVGTDMTDAEREAYEAQMLTPDPSADNNKADSSPGKESSEDSATNPDLTPPADPKPKVTDETPPPADAK
ncbi:hypothetical protein [Stieleria varia]|uniref:Uncharacterized protein n=1 Tax=Stieleria varia TaxID=2528005 RepID=A0A5C6AHY7_9BACT|nr:hypothetical protein [Stieleria varia]TWT98661.1 hypothetical protein Pla52n_51780 [Stieleria varia]